MVRKRNKENKGYPEGWRTKNGKIRYRVPAGMEDKWDGLKEFTLGKTESEAYRTWSNRLDKMDKAVTVAQVLDRYMLQVSPEKAPISHKDDIKHMPKVRKAFGHMLLTSVEPQHIYKYYDKRTAKTQGRKEIALLSHALTKAVEWGDIKLHPFIGQVVLKGGNKTRDRYVEDWEIDAFMALPCRVLSGGGKMLKAYVTLKILTGLRQRDMLLIKEADLKDDGIHVTPSKTQKTTQKKLIIEWTDALRAAIDEIRKVRPVDISPWLFCNKRGGCFVNLAKGTAEGFSSIWQRHMDRLIEEKRITERFTEHDLRAKTASDSDSDEDAQKRLAHSDSKITRKVYRRKAEIVKPLR